MGFPFSKDASRDPVSCLSFDVGDAADLMQTLAWVLLAMNGFFVSASTKSVFVPTLCVADVASDDERYLWLFQVQLRLIPTSGHVSTPG